MSPRVTAVSLALAAATGLLTPVAVRAQATAADDAFDIATMLTDETAVFPAMKSIWATTVQDRPDLRDLNAKDPLFVDFMWTRLEPEFKALLSRALPNVRRSAARVLHQYLAPADFQAVAAMYRTDAGKRIRMLGIQAQSFPAADRDRLYAQGMREIIASMSASDRAAAMAASPASPKLDAAYNPVMTAIGAEMRQAMAADGPHLQAIATQAAQDYLATKAERNGK